MRVVASFRTESTKTVEITDAGFEAKEAGHKNFSSQDRTEKRRGTDDFVHSQH